MQDTAVKLRHAYSEKKDTYFAGVRKDFLSVIADVEPGVVLEIGCGYGDTGAEALTRNLCRVYVGVELVPEAAALAKTNINEVLEGDVEHLEFPWPDNHFDAVLMSEVLEHLVDPWKVVKRVAKVMKPGALIMASSPNASQIRMIRNLFMDRWELSDSGLMDRTHLRWFTQNSYRRMFEEADICVDHVFPLAPPGPWGRLFNHVTLQRFSHLTMRQICIVGHKR